MFLQDTIYLRASPRVVNAYKTTIDVDPSVFQNANIQKPCNNFLGQLQRGYKDTKD
jgi:hypothetical protein